VKRNPGIARPQIRGNAAFHPRLIVQSISTPAKQLFRRICRIFLIYCAGGTNFRHFPQIFDRAGLNAEPTGFNVHQILFNVQPTVIHFCTQTITLVAIIAMVATNSPILRIAAFLL